MKKYYLFASLVLLAAGPGFAQVKIGATGAPDGSAMLEVTSGTSGNKGLLLPRMTLTQRNAIPAPATGLMIYNTTANQVQVNTGTPIVPIWVIATAANSGWDLTGNTGTNPATNFIGTSDNQALAIRTNNTEKVRVTAAGNMGIGTTAPSQQLHVADTGDVSILVAAPAIKQARVLLNNTNYGIVRNLTSSGGNGNDVALYTSSSVASVGDLHLVANPAATGSDSLPIDQFVLKNTGDIGIGTNTPARKLHVEGTARIATAIGTPTTITGRNAAGDVGNVTLGSGLALTGGVLNTTTDNADWNLTGNTGTNPSTNFIGTGDAQPLVIRTSNVEQVRVTAAGDVGIGTTAPAQSLHVQGTARIATAVGIPTTITGRNTAGDVGNVTLGSGLALTGGVLNTTADNADWNLTGNTGTNPSTNFIGTSDNQALAIRTNNTEKVRVTAAGNMGIGTTAPSQQLHVADTSDASILVTAPVSKQTRVLLASINHGIAYNLTSSGGNENDMAIYTNSSAASASDLHLVASPTLTSSNNLPLEQFVLKNTGDVGIGTNTPARKLHVEGTARIATAVGTPTTITGRNAAGDVGNVTLGSGLAITGGVLNTTADNADWNLTGNTGTNPSTNFIGTSDNQALAIRTNNTEQIRVTAAGDVGIGTTAPAQSLHVQGTARIATAVGTPTTITGRNTAGDVGNVTLGSGLALTGGVLNTTADNADWNLTGNTGTNPSTNFIGTSDNQALAIRTNNTEKVRVTAAGNMGIGTTAPSQQLHVADTGDVSILVAAPAIKQARVLLNNTNYGIVRNLTSSGGNGNDVALYTSSSVGSVGDLHLVANPAATGSDSLPIDQFVLKNTGEVGIGTNTPARKLHVEGTARIATAVGTPTTITGRNAAGDVGNVTLGSGLAITGGVLNTTADNADWNLTGNTGTNPATNFIGTGDAQPLVIRTSNVEQVRVTAAGDVGIGTNAPAQSLHVQGTARIATAVGTPNTITGRNAAGDVGNVTLGSGLALTGGVLNTTADNADWNLTGNTGTNPSTNFIGTSDNQALAIRTNNTEQIRVTAAGDVGIGTTAPAQSLHVQGTARIAIAVGTPNTITGRNAAGDVGNVTVGSGLALTAGVLTATSVADNTDWDLTGNSGTNPSTNFIGTSDNQALAIRTNNTEQIRVTGAGSVGIGTQNPSSKLNVNEGSLNVSSTATLSSSAIAIINDGGGAGGNDDIRITSYGASTSPMFNMFSAHGTVAAPVNLQSGDAVGAFNITGQVNGSEETLSYIRSFYLGDGTTRKTRMSFNTGDGGGIDMSIDSSGYVGINTIHPTANFSVNGTTNNTSGAWSIFSDARVKTVDGEYEDGLATVMKIHPVKFHYNANAPFKSAEQQIGIIAQEMEQIAPYMVSKVNADGFTDLRQYNNQALPYMLVNAIQEQQAQIEMFKVQIEALKAKNEQLETANKVTAQLMERVKQMEQMMGIKEIEGTLKVAGK